MNTQINQTISLDKRNFVFATSAMLLVLLFIMVIAKTSHADDFKVGQIASDGKNGRPFQQIRLSISDRPVESVTVRLQKQSGGNDTFVNLRFGSGETFEGGRRETLNDTQSKSVTWNLNGEKANGQQLVLNAYNGEVYIHNVSVRYAGSNNQEKDRVDNKRENWRENSRRHSERDSYNDEESVSSCRDNLRRMRPPRIEVSDLRPSGGLLSGKYRIGGIISGQCIEEAGYYEQGRLKEKIEIPLSDRFARSDFRVQVRSGYRGEIRVYMVDGTEEAIYVDDEIARSEAQRPY